MVEKHNVRDCILLHFLTQPPPIHSQLTTQTHKHGHMLALIFLYMSSLGKKRKHYNPENLVLEKCTVCLLCVHVKIQRDTGKCDNEARIIHILIISTSHELVSGELFIVLHMG